MKKIDKDKNKIVSNLKYFAAVFFYICAIIIFINKDNGMGFVFLCSGSAFLCLDNKYVKMLLRSIVYSVIWCTIIYICITEYIDEIIIFFVDLNRSGDQIVVLKWAFPIFIVIGFIKFGKNIILEKILKVDNEDK